MTDDAPNVDASNIDTPSDVVPEDEAMGDDAYVRVIEPEMQHEDLRKLFVSDIPSSVTDDEFQRIIVEVADSGDADDVLEGFKLIRKQMMRFCYAFVMFTKTEILDEVLLKRDQLKSGDRPWNANRSMPKHIGENKDRVKKMFISNVPYHDCTEDDLLAYFSDRHARHFGTIEKISLVQEKLFEGCYRNKGFGFMEVSSEDLCDKLAIAHADFNFNGRSLQLKKSYSLGQGGGRIQEMYQSEQQRAQQRKMEAERNANNLEMQYPYNLQSGVSGPGGRGRGGFRGRRPRRRGRLSRMNNGTIGVDSKGWAPKCIPADEAPPLLANNNNNMGPGGGYFMYVPTAPARYQPY